mgnify:FL=1|tara:strand:- start:61 stop:567 length:507 start_codon:yes stop_codon:yes gene_type:complete
MDHSILKDAKTIVMVFNVFNKECAAIAGGCLRDLETGREPRDIDIIVQYEDPRDFAEAQIQARFLGYTATVFQMHAEYPLEGICGAAVMGIAKLEHPTKLPIDIIFRDGPIRQVIEDFPCNAVKVYMVEDDIVQTPEYQEFLDTGKLTFHKGAPEAYKEKLLSYYPQD